MAYLLACGMIVLLQLYLRPDPDDDGPNYETDERYIVQY